ncbi:epimerase, partial [Dyadobacter jiangsuensis]
MNGIESFEEQWLSPSEALIDDMKRIEGDIMILGAGGKIGPSIARLTMQAIERAGLDKRVIAVSRFSEEGLAQELNAEGIETIVANILDDSQLQDLPEVENVLYLA